MMLSGVTLSSERQQRRSHQRIAACSQATGRCGQGAAQYRRQSNATEGDCGLGSPLQDFQQRLTADFRGTLGTTPIARDEGRAFDDSEGGRPSWRCRLSLPTCCEMLWPPPRTALAARRIPSIGPEWGGSLNTHSYATWRESLHEPQATWSSAWKTGAKGGRAWPRRQGQPAPTGLLSIGPVWPKPAKAP